MIREQANTGFSLKDGGHRHLGLPVSNCEILLSEPSFEGVELGCGQFLGLIHWAMLQLRHPFLCEHLGSGFGQGLEV